MLPAPGVLNYITPDAAVEIEKTILHLAAVYFKCNMFLSHLNRRKETPSGCGVAPL
jgi:hypothetical protein